MKGMCLCVFGVILLIIPEMNFQSQNEDHYSGDSVSCKKLTGSSIRITCEENGEVVPCNDLHPGITAKASWKSNVIKNSKKLKTIVCSQNGKWEIKKVKPQYLQYDGLGLLKIIPKLMNRGDADRVCEREGGHLFNANSQKAIDAVADLFASTDDIKFSGDPRQNLMWVQPKYKQPLRQFVSDQNEPFDFGWAEGEPNSNGKERCLAISTAVAPAVPRHHDVPCFLPLPPICQL